jgi:hypothetical protein
MPASRPAIGSSIRKEGPSGEIRLRHASPMASTGAAKFLTLKRNPKRKRHPAQPWRDDAEPCLRGKMNAANSGFVAKKQASVAAKRHPNHPALLACNCLALHRQYHLSARLTARSSSERSTKPWGGTLL